MYQSKSDYEYFQLFDPDDSDLDLDEPDVRKLLTAPYNTSPHIKHTKIPCYCWVNTSPKYWIVIGIAMLLLTIFLAIGFGVSTSNSSITRREEDPLLPAKGSSILGNYSRAAVAADGGEICAKIGVNVMQRQNGSAVDAAIATLFCNGLVASQSMGIGGGFLMTIYDSKAKKVTTIDARETAPHLATVDMFLGDPELSAHSALSVAVPGEIKGYAKAKALFGNPAVSWESLMRPSIDLARNGIPVTFSKAAALRESEGRIRRDEGMREIYINPATNATWREGETYKRTKFADTLERIAKLGFEEFYQGKTAKGFVEDLKQLGGIVTLQDLKDYEVVVSDPISVELSDGLKLYSVPPPGSGAILAFIVSIMDQYNLTSTFKQDPLTYHRLVESFKYAYAYRSRLGDPFDKNITKQVNEIVGTLTSAKVARDIFGKINDSSTSNDPKYYGGDFQGPEDHGTSHTSVLAPNGDAVAVTSTVNLHFGPVIMSPSTGIIYNDEMDDFSSPNITNEFDIPPSPSNFIQPGKRPLSSMCPVILIDHDGQVKLVTGAAGGSRITSATAFTILNSLWLGDGIKSSIDAFRIHHQLVPMRVDYERGFPQDILDGLKSRGHVLNQVEPGKSIVSGIFRQSDGRIYANSDYRKAGGVDGF